MDKAHAMDMSHTDMTVDVQLDMTSPAVEPAKELVVSVEPTRAVYKTTQKINLSASVLDALNLSIFGTQLTWSVTPSLAAQNTLGSEWTLMAQGPVTFEACTDRLSLEGEPVCGQLTIHVDDAPPTITLDTPQPGQEIDGRVDANILVSGSIVDTHGALFAMVNGQPLELDDEGRFSTMVTPRFGINHIAVSAHDGVNPSVSVTELDVLWAPSFHASEMSSPEGLAQAAVSLENGLVLNLGQNFFDDGQMPLPDGLAGGVLVKDLADVLGLVLDHLDLNALITNPVVDSGALKLFVHNLRLSDPVLAIDITDSGIELFLQTDSIVGETQGALHVVDEQLDLTGNMRIAASVLARISIEKKSAQDEFDVRITHLDVAIERAHSEFTDPRANAVFNLAQSALRGQIEQLLIDVLKGSFIDTVPLILADALNSLDAAVGSQSFELDIEQLSAEPISVEFTGSIDGLDKEPRTCLKEAIKTRVAIAKAVTKDSLGVAIHGDAVQENLALPEFFESSRLQIGVRLALLNALLHEAWSVGLFDVDISSQLPDGLNALVRDASLSIKLSPIMELPLQADEYDLYIRMGQVELVATFPTQTVRYGASLGAGVHIGVKNNALSIEIAQEPKLDVWVIDVSKGNARLSASQLRDLILTALWPELTAALQGGFSVPLPVIGLSGLEQYSPAFADFNLLFEQVRDVVVRHDFLIVDSVLRGTFIPPVSAP